MDAGMDANIDEITVEIPEKNTKETDVSSNSSNTSSTNRRKMSNTAMDIYAEIRSTKEDELKEVIDEKNARIAQLEQKVKTLENAMKETIEDEQDRGKKKRKLADSCKEESKVTENLRAQVDNLTNRLSERESELHELREKMAEAEWSESSEIEKLKKEINQLKKQDTKKPAKEKTEVNLICEKIQSIIGERMDKLEEKMITIEKNQTDGGQKLIHAVNTVTDQAATYASIISGNVASSQTTGSTNENDAVNIRDIMRQSKNEEMQEEAEKRRRDCNSAVHGVDPNVEPSEYIDNLIKNLSIGAVKPKSVKRVGNGEKKPLIITFRNSDEKSKFMSSLNGLKGKNEYKSIHITDDYTINERNLIRQLSEQAKQKNIEEGSSNIFSWRVRGSSKNGFRIMKVYKKTEQMITR